MLWEEYREAHPEGYGYSRFCDLYREFERRLTPVMRQHHAAGDKVFVDYSGKKVGIVDSTTGIVREAEIFVAVLGASSLTYAEATWTQTLPDWIGAHVRLFRFLGGVPRLVVPDNLKSGVHKASFYDPELNRSYGMMAEHYGVGVLPARPRKPRDKAKVEAGVRFAQSYILGRLRQQTFFSLAECNAAIAAMVERINAHLMRRLGTTRRALFEAIERAALRPLPAEDYSFAEWRLARVNLDYHVEAGGFLYSVPHALIREQVDVRLTARTVEVFHRGQRVAAHERRYTGRRHGTNPDHMPSAHRRYAEWSPERFRRWARSIGPETEGLVIAILHDRPHPEQGFRTCLGLLRLYRGLDPSRGEAASAGRGRRGAHLHQHRRNPGQGPRSRSPACRGRPGDAPPQPARPALLPLTETTMLSHPTLDLLHELGLRGMASGFKALDANPKARPSAMPSGSDCSSTTRPRLGDRSASRPALAPRGCAHPASIEDVDYRSHRGLDRALFLKLATSDWIRTRRNLVITGPCGGGKSWLACALGHKACRDDLSVVYYRVPRLFTALALAPPMAATAGCCARSPR